mmetsp:Transcript_16991/g.22880  ORF Transcript_16991/g.22880 Transcript_16991/m.22880 type:complete len:94 (-) Transcript_16991:82-363(-)|eukprot:CAMPEP_0170466684 /NCGR_PEP_ID=MMETSP0123-20130129/10549_1 /TAXON_ID=182087 /ORGANISM="Favella ehrenbergii, Strain Fehren 1" /LENGTH=93 /DNA_ID=CAMNT_0010732869 /DNA_START=204 /DNA_END=485 /DNA_ORIENTATION=+
MGQFDREILECFRDMEKPPKPIKITGSSTVYNFVEECHKFKARKFELKGEEGFQEGSEMCEIISVNARNNPVEKTPVEPQRGRNRGGRRQARH